jgi:hypothetical protein
MREYQDPGGRVLTVHDVRARGRGGIPVEKRAAARLWKVGDGKLSVARVFGSAADALRAVGLQG